MVSSYTNPDVHAPHPAIAVAPAKMQVLVT